MFKYQNFECLLKEIYVNFGNGGVYYTISHVAYTVCIINTHTHTKHYSKTSVNVYTHCFRDALKAINYYGNGKCSGRGFTAQILMTARKPATIGTVHL